MQLYEFITETLTQIVTGIDNANERLAESDAVVNPRHINYNENPEVRTYGWLSREPDKLPAVHLIDFDVSVTATEGKENKGGIGVSVGNIGLGTMRKNEQEQIAQNKIRFSIPLVMPSKAVIHVEPKADTEE